MTQDQYIASDPAISAWVSASAGTGKTKVLTDRVLRLLLEGNAPSRILCITYTKAAAAEMEQRIDEKLAFWAVSTDEEVKKSLSDLTNKTASPALVKRARQLFAGVLDSAERLRIQTIHGFCQTVLTRFPLEAGVPPHFTLIDERTSSELLREARLRLFTSTHEFGSDCAEAINKLATLISEKTLDELLKDIVSARRKFLSCMSMEGGLQGLHSYCHEWLRVPFEATVQSLADIHLSLDDNEIAQLRAACAVLAQSSVKLDMATLQALQARLEQGDYDLYLQGFLTREGLPRKDLSTVASQKNWPPLKDLLAEEQKRAVHFGNARKALNVALMTRHATVLARTLLQIYSHLKDLHGYLDYDDLIVKAVNLLTRDGSVSWVLYKLDGGIDHLLVDEAQDTSPEQWRLVEALVSEFYSGDTARSKTRTLFVVGDEKQSIYSFQGADPWEFDNMQRQLSQNAKAAGADFQRVRLSLSFRSAEPVLKAVDSVFALPQARDGLVFTEQEISHALHRKGQAGRVELWPLIEAEGAERPSPWYVADKAYYQPSPESLCARSIAATISGWLKEKRMLPSQARAITPGDILILVQRRGAFSNAMVRYLKQEGVPVAGSDRMVLTEHIAVMDCIALGEFLLLPRDDLTLASLLKSPFIGLAEEELFELSFNRQKTSLWQRLRENKKFERHYHFLSELLSRTDYLPPYELFAHALETLGGRARLAARLGHEIDDPLNEFMNLCLEYGKTHPPSLQGFLSWLKSGGTEVKRDMEKSVSEVRILTVHGAKGLQAPIVFLPDTARLPRPITGILWNNDTPAIPLWPATTDADDRISRGLRDGIRREREQEYRRLLYVAMTRAEDELYICGWKGSKAIPATCWYELVRQAAADSLWQNENGKSVIASPQTASPSSKAMPPVISERRSVPDWAYHEASAEPLPPKPLAPSRLEEPLVALSPAKNQQARERGILIHRILQYLPDVAEGNRKAAAKRFILRYGRDFSEPERERIEQETLGILSHPDFAEAFGPHSVAEAPISGVIHDHEGRPVVISGQIDRLAVMADEVLVIDYKTNRDIPSMESKVSSAYIRQMDAYRRLLIQIYPGRTIRCALLWTASPQLMVLSEDAMKALAA